MSVPAWAIALILAIWLALVLSMTMGHPIWTRRQRAIIRRHFEEEEPQEEAAVSRNGTEQLLLAAGVHLGEHAVWKYKAIRLTIFVVVLFASALLALPGALVLTLAILAAFTPDLVVRMRIASRVRGIEREIPDAYSRIAAMMGTQPNVAELLRLEAEQLRINNPVSALAAELDRTAKDIHARGVDAALQDLETRSPTPALADMAFTLRLYATSGGTFAKAFASAADRARLVLEGRNKAEAKAAQAKVLVIMLIGILVAALLFSMGDPDFRRSYYTATGQMLLAATVFLMALGYVLVEKMINDVTK